MNGSHRARRPFSGRATPRVVRRTISRDWPTCLLVVAAASVFCLATRVDAGVMVPLNRLDGGSGSSSSPSNRLPEVGRGVSHLQTNLPAPFSGANVGDIIGANTFYN